MSDLTDAELRAATTVHDRLKAVNERAWVDPVALIEADRLQRAALEIQRHRAATVANRALIYGVVYAEAMRKMSLRIDLSDTHQIDAAHIATRAAERLATAASSETSERYKAACRMISRCTLEVSNRALASGWQGWSMADRQELADAAQIGQATDIAIDPWGRKPIATAPAPPSKRKRLVTDTCESCGALPGSLCVGPTECEA